LAIAFLLEGASWTIAVREFDASRGGQSWWQAIRRSKDPAGFTVLFEDSAALAGLLIAAAGIWLSHWTGDARIDGAASIAIGLILGAVAMLLAREAKELLIGEAADPALIESIWRIVEARPEISAVNHVRTIHTAPDSIFVAVSADFEDHLPMGDVETVIEAIETQLKAASAKISSIYIRPEKREDAVVQARA
ncbi:MAG: cation diffusion facilitator family transporter, partial [Sphingopyxis sp.]